MFVVVMTETGTRTDGAWSAKRFQDIESAAAHQRTLLRALRRQGYEIEEVFEDEIRLHHEEAGVLFLSIVESSS